MTHRQMVLNVLTYTVVPLSDYGIYHAARAIGYRMSPSSVRTRRAELVKAGKVVVAGSELTPTRRARTFVLAPRS